MRTIMPNRVIRLFSVAICFCGFQLTLFSNQQADPPSKAQSDMALAYPMSPIVVDGEISEWPPNATRYTLDHFFKRERENVSDFNAYFQIGYHLAEQSLFIAVVVSDDVHVVNSQADEGLYSQDYYELYLDIERQKRGAEVLAYRCNDKWKNVEDSKLSWDPEAAPTGMLTIESACVHQNGITTYECKILLKDRIQPGTAFGIGHLVADNDGGEKNDGYSISSWGKDFGKTDISGELGTVLLMHTDEPPIVINGMVKWENPVIKDFPGEVIISSTSISALWIKAPVSPSGSFTAALPAGTYQVSPLKNYISSEDLYLKYDRHKSSTTLTIKDRQESLPHTVVLSTLPPPDMIPAQGILHDFDHEKADLLDQFIKVYQDYYDIPGVSLALIKENKIIYKKTYGFKNAYTQEQLSDDTLFEAGSITKPVFAYAVRHLVERGVIEMDRPLYQYLPFEDIDQDERCKLITARHILCHQSGLPNWAQRDENGKFKMISSPGTKFGYSGEGYEYLQRVIEHVLNKDIDAILNEEVIRPLGLINIYFKGSPDFEIKSGHGHIDGVPTRIRVPDRPNVAWSMSTAAGSFAPFIIALINRVGLKPESYREMFKLHTTIPLDDPRDGVGWDKNIYLSLGFVVERTPYGAAYGHGGSTIRGFECSFKLFDELNMGYIILSNSNTGAYLVGEPIRDFLVTGRKQ